jgi:hypothetical protein
VKKRLVVVITVLCWLPAVPERLSAAEWFVSREGAGTGTASAPFGRIQDAITAAQPGDVITIASGTYEESLRTVRGGTPSQAITIRAAGNRGTVTVTSPGRVLTVGHPHITVERLLLDGQYGGDDLARIGSAAHYFTLRDSELRRTSFDAIDIGAAADVLIEASLIHHALNATGGRRDAHAIVAGGVRRLRIRDTEMHTFSGDGFQIDPGRAPNGWSDVTIEGCRIWLTPLPDAENGFPAGTVPGENAVDTKASRSAPRATLTIRNTVASGFRGGLIGNMAAFNLKENVDVVLDGITVYDSEIAFRTRGPRAQGGASVRIQNAVVYDVGIAFRYEDNVGPLRIWNVTLGAGVKTPFRIASSRRSVLDVRNVLILGEKLPKEAPGPSNRAVDASSFVDPGAHDYRLSVNSPAIDIGVTIPEVTHDRSGTPRPHGSRYDIGAYEQPGDAQARLRRHTIEVYTAWEAR